MPKYNVRRSGSGSWSASFDTAKDYQALALMYAKDARGNLKNAEETCWENLGSLLAVREMIIQLIIKRTDEHWDVLGNDIRRHQMARRFLIGLKPPYVAFERFLQPHILDRYRALATLGLAERNRKVFQALSIVVATKQDKEIT